MLSDDLPWPELGNVSRGATRGNQGQKGVLGPLDSEGRAILQLRVQPGVLAVRLNQQATDWYLKLDVEVNRALKLTKTYWRKARRRQDYDARADQDHMELHEWLQQLKDKVMSHLELLMQKGEIQGPPYAMSDHLELTFLRKFIERQAAGIPHNPRLREAYKENSSPASRAGYQRRMVKASDASGSPASVSWDGTDNKESSHGHDRALSPASTSTTADVQVLLSEVDSNKRFLHQARATLTRAKKEAQEAFVRYQACLGIESKAQDQVSAAEERRDALLSSLVEAYNIDVIEASETSFHAEAEDTVAPAAEKPRSKSGAFPAGEQPSCSIRSNSGALRGAVDWTTPRSMQWSPAVDSVSERVVPAHKFSKALRQHNMQFTGAESQSRKHSRDWASGQGQSEFEDDPPPPPRKRSQHIETEDFSTCHDSSSSSRPSLHI